MERCRHCWRGGPEWRTRAGVATAVDCCDLTASGPFEREERMARTITRRFVRLLRFVAAALVIGQVLPASGTTLAAGASATPPPRGNGLALTPPLGFDARTA